MKRQPHMSKNVTAAVRKRQENIDAMRGQAHKKTAAQWATDLGVGTEAITKYARNLGEKCAPATKLHESKRKQPNQYRDGSQEESMVRLMVEWAKRPIR